jgi:hypothetical protein
MSHRVATQHITDITCNVAGKTTRHVSCLRANTTSACNGPWDVSDVFNERVPARLADVEPEPRQGHKRTTASCAGGLSVPGKQIDATSGLPLIRLARNTSTARRMLSQQRAAHLPFARAEALQTMWGVTLPSLRRVDTVSRARASETCPWANMLLVAPPNRHRLGPTVDQSPLAGIDRRCRVQACFTLEV